MSLIRGKFVPDGHNIKFISAANAPQCQGHLSHAKALPLIQNGVA